MATFNGEAYIQEQIKSIQDQSYSDWHLFIKDDCSSDNTVSIIKDIIKDDKRISLSCNNLNCGSSTTFSQLLNEHKDSDYLMFADQDDIWKKDKIQKSILLMQKIEYEKGCSTPVLLFCDKTFVDEKLNVIKEDKQRNNYSFKNVLCQDQIFGNTMLLNKSLLLLVNYIPTYATNHDYWIALNASLINCVYKLEESLILYRQHNSNVTGGMNNYSIIKKINNKKKTDFIIQKTIKMNYLFCKNHLENCISKQYVSIVESRGIKRLAKMIRFGLKRDSLLGTIRYYIVFMKYKNQ